MILLKYVYNKRSIAYRKKKDGAKASRWKITIWCNNVQLNNVQLLIETSSDKLQMLVSQSMSAVLRQSV